MTIEQWDGQARDDDRCDFLIIGGGAAGLSIAQALAKKDRRIIVAEGGLDEFEPISQELYDGQWTSMPIDLGASRLRMLGGSTNHWGGRSHPFEPHMFENRPWLGASGWPISFSEFQPFVAPAMDLLDIPAGGFDADPWRPDNDILWPFDPAIIVERCWRFSPPTILQEKLDDFLKHAPNVVVRTGCNLVDIRLSADLDTVESCMMSTLDGKRASIRTRYLVLAAGGIENARLLLASNSQVAAGIGNGHGNVGRYFQGHPVYDPIEVQLLANQEKPAFLDRYPIGKSEVEGMLSLAPQAQKEDATTGIDCAFYSGGGQFGSPGVQAMRRIWHAIKSTTLPDDLGNDLSIIAGDLDGSIEELIRRAGFKRPGKRFTASVLVEQQPNPQSRVTLSAKHDALGMPRSIVDWRLSDMDRHTVRRFAYRLGQELGRMNVARVRLADYITDPELPFPKHGNSAHHIGTTRMSASAKHGVVDRNCRLFDVKNLYVAGSSVFPIGTSLHPTLNLTALALRLAARLDTNDRMPVIQSGIKKSDAAKDPDEQATRTATPL